jgi:MinD-like ATPase involved in chromosome partitioning or flagellar assembly
MPAKKVMDEMNRNLNCKTVALTGHYGSGKTEVAVNMAIHNRRFNRNSTVIDLDIANPYFRSREVKDVLFAKGIEVIGNAYGYDLTADLPALSPMIRRRIANEDYTKVIDVGGNESGARILNQYKNLLRGVDAANLIVVNVFRPETDDVGKIVRMIRSIEDETGQVVRGIVNNSNLLRETELEHILEGKRILEEVAGVTGIPVTLHCCERKFYDALARCCDNVFPVDLYMRPHWLDM